MTSQNAPDDADLRIRPPRQARSRQVWARILDAGVAIIEEGGYEAFTIAAVCERANVAPPTVYARVDTKDALFLAVYEHGIARLGAGEAVFGDPRQWAGLTCERLVREAVAALAQIFLRNARFLGAVVLISGGHPEIKRRGSAYAHRLGDAFTGVLLGARHEIAHPDPHAAVRACYDTLFSALVLRVAYGPGFAVATTTDAAFTAHLTEIAVRYLLRDSAEHLPTQTTGTTGTTARAR
ncbi:AcrR family transcriptional regulator [Thermocatellispora tengchongensis]|uniref:AcrR family transcriptional regulator n=1 Tax=Thermocatellispora tengchongensis TaxID=1073253 RepID=A0A840P7P5_9ACTN|nr:TetR/AcrR family transcriptional regulator [Thermocatellispora tengchongensis]MBB5135688.1 AcrR family transcriptional regulator [Thermocatellispora tengchongensis]